MTISTRPRSDTASTRDEPLQTQANFPLLARDLSACRSSCAAARRLVGPGARGALSPRAGRDFIPGSVMGPCAARDGASGPSVSVVSPASVLESTERTGRAPHSRHPNPGKTALKQGGDGRGAGEGPRSGGRAELLGAVALVLHRKSGALADANGCKPVVPRRASGPAPAVKQSTAAR
jgi:hypothetical protein